MEFNVSLDDEVRFNYKLHPLEGDESLGGKVVEIIDFGNSFKIDLKKYRGSEVKEEFGKVYVERGMIENLRVVK